MDASPLRVADITLRIASHLEFADLNTFRQVSKFHRELLDECPATQRALWRKPVKCGVIDFDRHAHHHDYHNEKMGYGTWHPLPESWNFSACRQNKCKPIITENPISDDEYAALLKKSGYSSAFCNPMVEKLVPGLTLKWACQGRCEGIWIWTWDDPLPPNDFDVRNIVSHFEHGLHGNRMLSRKFLSLCNSVSKLPSLPADWSNQFLTQPPVRRLTIGWLLTYIDSTDSEDAPCEAALRSVDRNYRTPKLSVQLDDAEGIKLGKFIEAVMTSACEFNQNWSRKAVVTKEIKDKLDSWSHYPKHAEWKPAVNVIISLVTSMSLRSPTSRMAETRMTATQMAAMRTALT